jgi:hypothetical protein
MATISIDTSRIKSAVRAAFRKTAKEIDKEFSKAIEQPTWSWPRGESPRDIVDTGDLLYSQRYQVNGTTATYEWPVPYAIAAHNGAVLKNGTIQPARRWTAKALQARPPNQIFATLLPSYL